MAKIESVVKGDVIIERGSGKNRMIPVRKIEFNACSKPSVHINNDSCYDWGTDVRLVEGEGTLGDLEKEISEMEEDFDPGVRVSVGDVLSKHEDLADRLVKI